jgi:hypothetical protein
MKMVKSLLLGTAAGLVAMAGAQAADLPVKAKPVQYVKICSLYGAGFYYIPGTDTCIKIGGFVRAEVNFNAKGSFAVESLGNIGNANNYAGQTWRSRAAVTFDARSQTEYGTLRSYAIIASTSTNSQAGAPIPTYSYTGTGNFGNSALDPYTALWSNAAFVQIAGFTAGKTDSFFDFDTNPYSNQTNFLGSNLSAGGIDLFAYTAQFGNGLSASIAAEDAAGHRMGVWDGTLTAISTTGSVNPVPAIVYSTYSGWQYANQQMPDVVGNVRIDQAWGSAQVMGAYHQLDLISNTTATAAGISDSGYAVGAGLKVNLPMLGMGDNVLAQLTYAQGAMEYVASGDSTGGLAVRNSGGTITTTAPSFDGIVDAGGSLHQTTGWSITGGYEHHWNPMWKTSLFGAYGEMSYDAAATAVLGGSATNSANWSFTQVGSRTVWTPVANLDLSVEVMYNNLNTALPSSGVNGNLDWMSGIFRVQRNFWP